MRESTDRVGENATLQGEFERARLGMPPIARSHDVPSTIIAGFDGSDASRAAVRFAARMAGSVEGEVVAVTGYPVPPRVLGKGAADGATASLASDARAQADLTLAELQEDGIASRVVRPGGPAQALIEAADELGADLIVVGTHHSSGPGRLALSTTGDRLIHGAPCPVSIVPADLSVENIETIGVAYDDSTAARTAIEYAARLARAIHARLVVISVVEPFAGHLETSHEDDVRFRNAVADAADAAAASLGDDLESEVRTLPGQAGEMLVAAAKEGIDLLVAGSRAYGPLRAVLAGSVSRYLADHAPCPLIVVPRQLN
jgi:nucleotide-binding universal stress UspA family protein